MLNLFLLFLYLCRVIGAYELKFDEIFQKYWQNNRTITDELRNILKTPKQANLRLEGLPNSKSVS